MAEGQRLSMFCEECGNMIRLGSWGAVYTCELCEAKIPLTKLKTASAPTKREFNYKKEWLLKYQAVQSKSKEEPLKSKQATIERECPNEECDSKLLFYRTAQLRSADEGQTVFYECTKCGFKFNEQT
eukprot:TRINITY_DN14720_c0_g3_i1.p1 TRINITY_DN14720_c0_g3~~TRINITY_DN14720_c0_g3_i1.p1  ORF type:complete len:145 (+),score=48.36 TRINITY_DN14720_c0_g3_i1:55-435(+)